MYQGRTHNHLTWVMVDSTDFATPESALSGAKIMINGKLQSTSLLYFVSSGTGSLTGGDIKHVGASATGVYTVNLVKADLSDASAAWYDQYIFTITGTGAAIYPLVWVRIIGVIRSIVIPLLQYQYGTSRDQWCHVGLVNMAMVPGGTPFRDLADLFGTACFRIENLQ